MRERRRAGRERARRSGARDAGTVASDERGVSTALGYVLSLSIAALLVSGLMLAGGSFVRDQRSTIVREELTVLGEHVASDLAAADRAVRTMEGGGHLRTETTLPDQVAGSNYRVVVKSAGGDDYRVVLTAPRTGVSVSVGFVSQTPVVTDEPVTGGDVAIVYDDGAGTLEVRSDE